LLEEVWSINQILEQLIRFWHRWLHFVCDL